VQQAVIRVLGALADRLTLGKVLGTTFGGKRNVAEALGYALELGMGDYRNRYDRGDVAGRIVDFYPKSTWRGGCQVYDSEDPNEVTPFEAAVEFIVTKHDLWSRLLSADIVSGIGRYSVLVLGAEGTNWKQELPTISGPEGLLYLSPPYGEDKATISQWVEDRTNPRYAKPLFYSIKSTRADGAASIAQDVHWSRVIHVADVKGEDDIFAEPRLRRIWNRLDDLDKVVGGGSEAFWQRVHRGMQANVDKEVAVAMAGLPDGGKAMKDDLEKQFDEYVHGFRRYLRTAGVEIQEFGTDVSNFSNQVDALMTIIACAAHVPKRILMGTERGELASGQDKGEFDDAVQGRRAGFGERVVRQFFDRLISVGCLPEPADGSYDVAWPDIEEEDQVGKADITVKIADANQKQTSAGQPVIMSSAEIRDMVYGLDPLDELDAAMRQDDQALAAAAKKKSRNRARAQVVAAQRRLSIVRRVVTSRGSVAS
jgi:hypothetical protein